VTVCIGALTVAGPSIVLAADTRVTYGVSPVGPNDQAGKQYPLPPYNFVVAIAGSVTECHEFVGRLVQHLEALSKADRDPYREEIMEAINDSRFEVFRPKIDQALRANVGLTLKEWHDRFVPPEKFDPVAEGLGMRTIRSTPFNVSSIFAGFTLENTMFFCAKAMDHLQSESSPGVHVIGSGSIMAMNQLNSRNQNLAYGLARTIFHVHEAMIEARKEPTVGPPTNYLIVSKGRPLSHISPNSELLKRWETYYHERDTAGLDSPESHFAIQKEMRPVQLPPYDLALEAQD
jgi:20S proteasome alpha/beta subunit